MADTVPSVTQRPAWNRPFAEQLAFFRQKLKLPSERWDDIERAAHDRAFIVAGAQGADLLTDLHKAIGNAIEQGTGLEAFRKDFTRIVNERGWTGWTGEGSKAGQAWRTKVIYQTNMTTSYAAGRWQQLNNPELQKLRPYWEYHHNDSVVMPRPLHVSWNGLTLPADHAFWKTHYPPNGWGCQCRVVPVNKTKYLRAVANGRGPIDAPVTGNTEGIDQGFDYAPGAGIDTALRQLVQDRLIKYPPAISTALSRDVNRYINAQDPAPGFARKALDQSELTETLWLGFVERPAAISSILKQDMTGYMVTLRSDAPRHVNKHHATDGAGQRPALPDDYKYLIDIVNAPDSMRAGRDEGKFPRVVLVKEINGERYQAVFELQPGKKNRALSLVSLVIKEGA